jgi:hypothetical protein
MTPARDNVIPLPLRPTPDRGIQSTTLEVQICTSSPFDELTARLVMQRHAAGTLDPGIVAALLLAVGLQP